MYACYDNGDQMKIKLNGKEIKVKRGAKLREVLSRGIYEEGSTVAIIRPSRVLLAETREFLIRTNKGEMILRLNDSESSELFHKIHGEIAGKSIRWKTSKVLAIGSFPTNLSVNRSSYRYSKSDCFFALGGFDSRTTYLMIARDDHEGCYGAGNALVGRITRGKHLLDELEEGDRVQSVEPVIEKRVESNIVITDNLDLEIEDEAEIESYVEVHLNKNSPVSAEHFLVLAERKVIPITESNSTYAACSARMDVSLVPEDIRIRDEDNVTVRNDGIGAGRIYFYKVRRQISQAHNFIGTVVKGKNLIRGVKAGCNVTIVTYPRRILTIGLTQIAGEEFLRQMGFEQIRTGDTSDNAVIVEQEPELTMEVISGRAVETFGVSPEKIHEIELYDSISPKTTQYLRKMTGLDHKSIGTMKVHFTYEGLPMITFEGNAREASSLVPEASFKEVSVKGELGVTNMSRPYRGLIGIRLEESEEFGPTGEERYGTNIAGKLVSDLDRLMRGIKEGDVVYIKESTGKDRSHIRRKSNKRDKKGNFS